MSAAEPPFQQAIHELYSHHHGWLFTWLRRKLGCADNAADLAQDTFTRILSSRDVVASIREPRAYLSTTARRLVIDRARRKQIEEAYLQILTTLEALEQIAFVLEELSAKQRQAFLLYFLDGLTQVDIAAHMGISERMVRKHLMHALLHCSNTLDI